MFYAQEYGKIGKQILNIVESRVKKEERMKELRNIFDEMEYNEKFSVEEVELRLKLLKYN